jgi:hypothetical protein
MKEREGRRKGVPRGAAFEVVARRSGAPGTGARLDAIQEVPDQRAGHLRGGEAACVGRPFQRCRLRTGQQQGELYHDCVKRGQDSGSLGEVFEDGYGI